MSSLISLGWNSFFEEQRRAAEAALTIDPRAWRYARVIEEQRGLYTVAGEFDGWAEISGRFRHDAASAADYPAVGDWVCVTGAGTATPAPGPPDPDARAVIHRRLQRRGAVVRGAAGTAVEPQVIAANVDTIFLVTALTRDLNPRRLERYLTIVWEAGAVPVIVLNKADLCGDPDRASAGVRARVPFVDVVAVSATRGDGLDALMAYLRPSETVALLGSSGVGKSTIVNRLLGTETLRVSTLGADGKGRHTTTARHLVEIAGGALLIDTPGMRELQPWTDASAVDGAFDDIAELASGCRFADCGHAGEPGCAVAGAIDAGRLDPDRLEHYRRLVREAEFENRKRDKSAAAEQKRKWKQIHQAQKAMYRDRGR